MTPGHRVWRSRKATKKAAMREYPLAKVAHRHAGLWVCYESPEDAGEEHGAVSNVWAESLGPAGEFHRTESPRRNA